MCVNCTAQQPRAGDAAGAARESWRSRIGVPCHQPYRSPCLPAAHLTRDVGPPSSPKRGAGQTRQRDIIGHRPGITEHISNISGPIRALSDTRGSSRAVSSIAGHTVPYGPSRREWPVAGSRAVNLVACGIARRRTRRKEWSSCAVAPVAGHGVGNGCHVPYRPSPDTAFKDGRRERERRSPDRVRYRPSPDHVSSCPGPCRRPHVSTVVTVGCAERPSSAMPRPNIRL